MSLPATPFGGRFCLSRKVETGGGGWVHLKGVSSMAMSGLSYKNTLVGTGWDISLVLCINGPLFLVVKVFSQSG